MLYNLLLRDSIEICFYSLSIFALCKWLKIDKTKNLLGYFFAYSTLMIGAWIIELPTLAPFLFAYAPIALILFIVLHEKTLQRNLVTLCSITTAQRISADWIDALISSCLTLINTNKSMTIVIERQDTLDHFLEVPFLINADIDKNILEILLSSSSYNEHKMVWINAVGKIKGMNASWIFSPKQTIEVTSFAGSSLGNIKNNDKDLVFYTLQTDALILIASPLNRLFTLIINGQETKNITAHQVHTMIKREFSLTSLSQPHKGAFRENNAPEKSLSR